MTENTNLLRLRFNTENVGELFWRVIINDEEHLANSVQLHVPSFTSQDILPNGKVKFHISCFFSSLVWEGKDLSVF